MNNHIKAFLLNDTRTENHHGCTTVMTNIENCLKEQSIKVIGTSSVGKSWRSEQKTIDGIKQSDLVIINGEGSLHHSRPYAESLLEVIPYAKGLNKQVVLINTIWQDNSEQMSTYAKEADLIFVRDKTSQKELSQQGVTSTFVPDMTFYSNYEYRENKPKGIAITDSVYPKVTKECFNYSVKNQATFLPITEYITRNKIQAIGLKKFLKITLYKSLLKVFGPKLPIRTYYKGLLHSYATPSEYIKRLEEHSLVIAARFHTVCFCIQNQIPFIAISSNSHKVQALINDSGLNKDRIFQNIEEICTKDVDLLSTWNDEEKALIHDFNKAAKTSISNMFFKIKSLCEPN
jgi:polysaccharide pyruvyl transferase WcaK-like protein